MFLLLWPSVDIGLVRMLALDTCKVIMPISAAFKTAVQRYKSIESTYWLSTVLPLNSFDYMWSGVFKTPSGIAAWGCQANYDETDYPSFVAPLDVYGNPSVCYQYTCASDRVYFKGVCSDSSGSMYASCSYGGSDRYSIVKVNSDFSVAWAIGSNREACEVEGVCVDNSGNVYAVGSDGGGVYSGVRKGFVVKVNSSGTVQWQKSYGGTLEDELYRCKTDGSGNLYAVGRTKSSSTGLSDAWVVKFSPSGSLTWSRRVGVSSHNDGFYGIAIDSSNNIYCVGYVEGKNFIIKYDSNGFPQWQRSFSIGTLFDYNDPLFGCVVGGDGNVYASGWSSYPSGFRKGILLKVSSSGSYVDHREFRDAPSSGEYFYDELIYENDTNSLDVLLSRLSVNGLTVVRVPNSLPAVGQYGETFIEKSSYTFTNTAYTEAEAVLTLDTISNTLSNITINKTTVGFAYAKQVL